MRNVRYIVQIPIILALTCLYNMSVANCPCINNSTVKAQYYNLVTL